MELHMGPRSAILCVPKQRYAKSMVVMTMTGRGDGGSGRRKERGALSLQNEDPTP